MQGIVLTVFFGLSNVTALGLFIPYILILICTQLIYGFIIHRKGVLAKKTQESKDFDLNFDDPDILSNYIK
jgi:hypothetical protein